MNEKRIDRYHVRIARLRKIKLVLYVLLGLAMSGMVITFVMGVVQ